MGRVAHHMHVQIVWLAMDPMFSHKLKNGKPWATETHYYYAAMTISAWCCAEIVRYSFYGINTIRFIPRIWRGFE